MVHDFYMEHKGQEYFIPLRTNRGQIGYRQCEDGFEIAVEPAEPTDLALKSASKSIRAKLLHKALNQALSRAAKAPASATSWEICADGLIIISVIAEDELASALLAGYQALTDNGREQTEINRWIPETAAAPALLLIALGLNIRGANRRWSQSTFFDKIDRALPGS